MDAYSVVPISLQHRCKQKKHQSRKPKPPNRPLKRHGPITHTVWTSVLHRVAYHRCQNVPLITNGSFQFSELKCIFFSPRGQSSKIMPDEWELKNLRLIISHFYVSNIILTVGPGDTNSTQSSEASRAEITDKVSADLGCVSNCRRAG